MRREDGGRMVLRYIEKEMKKERERERERETERNRSER